MPQQRALAAAATSHDDKGVSRMNSEAESVQHRPAIEFSDEVSHFNDGLSILRFGIRGWRGGLNGFGVRHAQRKKKNAVRMALVMSTESREYTTDWVVALPTPSAPPVTSSPELQAIVAINQAKATLLTMPE
jgi:hypothetical protein